MRRRLRNEAEVEEVLSRLGFISVRLERLAFEQQVRLFANAEFIVAPHGAGLANCAFCRPGTRLIEIFGKKYTPGFFRRLAAICKLDYYCMVGGSPNNAPTALFESRRDADIEVDVDQLQRFVEKVESAAPTEV